MTSRLIGIVSPLLTPYENDLSIAESLYLKQACFCLEGGAHYLSPFGTTGEATSNTMRERMAMLERLITSETAQPNQLLPGTGFNHFRIKRRCWFVKKHDLWRHAKRPRNRHTLLLAAR